MHSTFIENIDRTILKLCLLKILSTVKSLNDHTMHCVLKKHIWQSEFSHQLVTFKNVEKCTVRLLKDRQDGFKVVFAKSTFRRKEF